MEIVVRNLKEEDLDDADRVFRLAFGTENMLPDPAAFGGDTDTVRTRWRAAPGAALAAEIDGRLVGSNFLARWGSFGLFGPLTVDPALWNRGIATRLLGPTLEMFESWGVAHTGIITAAKSPKHLALYQKFGYWPRFLTAIMERPIGEVLAEERVALFSSFPESHRQMALGECRDVTTRVYGGLDLASEIVSVHDQNLGDTALLWGRTSLEGFAVCHIGPGTEAGSGACYIKFGAVREGERLARLVNACAGLGEKRGATRVVAGVNTARTEAYRQMLALGFRTTRLDVAMHRPNEPGFNRPGVFVLDDWR